MLHVPLPSRKFLTLNRSRPGKFSPFDDISRVSHTLKARLYFSEALAALVIGIIVGPSVLNWANSYDWANGNLDTKGEHLFRIFSSFDGRQNPGSVSDLYYLGRSTLETDSITFQVCRVVMCVKGSFGSLYVTGKPPLLMLLAWWRRVQLRVAKVGFKCFSAGFLCQSEFSKGQTTPVLGHVCCGRADN